MARIDELFRYLKDNKGSDLHLAAGLEPRIRVHGSLEAVRGWPVLPHGELLSLLRELVNDSQWEDYSDCGDLDFAYGLEGVARFRANFLRQENGCGAVFRIIPEDIVPLEALNLPKAIEALAHLQQGLVLVTGPTGSGKSTTLAAIIDMINRDTTRHVISIEDPIEFVYPHRRALINQREVGTHLRSTSTALRSMLRQDPDVLVVGEMRDLPTISFAVTAAETGHLVFGTVHTASADTTIDRIMNAFPAGARDQVRTMLADSLRAILCQHLIPRRDGGGRVLAAEVLINNEAVAHLLRKGKAYQIPAVVATAREAGMQAMDVELRRLVRDGVISAEEAYMRATSKKDFEQADLPPASVVKFPAGH